MAVGVLLILGGSYLLVLLRSPASLSSVEPYTEQQIASIDKRANKVIIPKIGVNITYDSGDESVLEKGAWWRYPERGNPNDGGNFILSAHRFSLGLTPGQTRAKSPFYHIEKVNVGDMIVVDYQQKRYEYLVTDKFRVSPDKIDIESTSGEAKLTLYSCTLKGAQDGREVLIAKLRQPVQ